MLWWYKGSNTGNTVNVNANLSCNSNIQSLTYLYVHLYIYQRHWYLLIVYGKIIPPWRITKWSRFKNKYVEWRLRKHRELDSFCFDLRSKFCLNFQEIWGIIFFFCFLFLLLLQREKYWKITFKLVIYGNWWHVYIGFYIFNLQPP